MKTKHIKYLLASSLSLALVACNLNGPTQAPHPETPQQAVAPKAIVEKAQVTRRAKPKLEMAGEYRFKAGKESLKLSLNTGDFKTLFADPNDLDSFQIWVTGPGIDDPIYHDGFDDESAIYLPADSPPLTATVSDIPAQDGWIRVVTAQGFDDTPEALPAFYAKGYYVSTEGTSEVTLNFGRQHSLTAWVIENLWAAEDDRLDEIDLAALQTLMDEATGYDETRNLFARDPLLFNVQDIVDEIGDDGTLPDSATVIAEAYVAPASVTFDIDLTDIGGSLGLGESLQVVVNDPTSDIQIIPKGTADDGAFTFSGMSTGDWTLDIMDIDGNILGTTTVSVDDTGSAEVADDPVVLAASTQQLFNIDINVETDNGRPLAEEVVLTTSIYETDTNRDLTRGTASPMTPDLDLSGAGGTWTLYARRPNGETVTSTTFSVDADGDLTIADDPFILDGFDTLAGELPVNTITTGNQFEHSVAMNDDGSYIVVWATANGGSFDGLYARNFDATGTPEGSEYLLNSPTTRGHRNPEIAMNSSGEYVVAYTTEIRADDENWGIEVRKFDADGSGSSAFHVNTFTDGFQANHHIAMNDNGEFVVVWQSNDGDGYGIFGQMFDNAGSPVGGEIPINSFTDKAQLYPEVAVNSAGQFMVVWENGGSYDGSATGVVGRVFDNDGDPLTDEFIVNKHRTSNQRYPTIAANADGNFIVAWESYWNQDGDDNGIFAQLVDLDGEALTDADIPVNSYTVGAQTTPELAVDGDGNFVVTWESDDGDGTGIYARAFDSNGEALGSDIQINTYTANVQTLPEVSLDENGVFVVAWVNDAGDGNKKDISTNLHAFPKPAP